MNAFLERDKFMNIVSFPGLGLEFEINKIAFTIFGVQIYKYAICILTRNNNFFYIMQI